MLIGPIIEMYREKTGERIRFDMRISEDFSITSNKSALARIIVNIVSNAVDAIGLKNGTIEIIARENPGKEIAIKDNGCGIEHKNMNRIFELGFTTKENGKGTGMGLYIVKELAEKLGIKVAMESKLGIGTEITLRMT